MLVQSLRIKEIDKSKSGLTYEGELIIADRDNIDGKPDCYDFDEIFRYSTHLSDEELKRDFLKPDNTLDKKLVEMYCTVKIMNVIKTMLYQKYLSMKGVNRV